jgi:hypothetical protein
MRRLFFTVIDAADQRLAFFARFSRFDWLQKIQIFPSSADRRKHHSLVWRKYDQYLPFVFVGFVFSHRQIKQETTVSRCYFCFEQSFRGKRKFFVLK